MIMNRQIKDLFKFIFFSGIVVTNFVNSDIFYDDQGLTNSDLNRAIALQNLNVELQSLSGDMKEKMAQKISENLVKRGSLSPESKEKMELNMRSDKVDQEIEEQFNKYLSQSVSIFLNNNSDAKKEDKEIDSLEELNKEVKGAFGKYSNKLGKELQEAKKTKKLSKL